MGEPFIGSEALAAGQLKPYELRSRFVALHHDVYISKHVDLTAVLRAKACWLWARRRGVLAGFSASALHGARWIDAAQPANIIYDNRHAPSGVETWADQTGEDEIVAVDGMRVTTPARTAFDLASRYPTGSAVAAIDALVQATDLKLADVELLAQRYRRRRGIRRARVALDLVDGGAESPRETWLRLLLIRAGFPRPQTQIPVHDEFGSLIARADMGWEEMLVAVEYEGDHHRTNRKQFNKDIERMETLTEMGWAVVRVTAEDCPAGIIRRVATARARRV